MAAVGVKMAAMVFFRVSCDGYCTYHHQIVYVALLSQYLVGTDFGPILKNSLAKSLQIAETEALGSVQRKVLQVSVLTRWLPWGFFR